MPSRAQYLSALKRKATPVGPLSTSAVCNGKILRQAREALGLSVAEVAEDLGISTPIIYQMENSKYVPSLGLAIAVCEFYEIPFTDVWKLDRPPVQVS